jgi:hypothetical protein
MGGSEREPGMREKAEERRGDEMKQKHAETVLYCATNGGSCVRK